MTHLIHIRSQWIWTDKITEKDGDMLMNISAALFLLGELRMEVIDDGLTLFLLMFSLHASESFTNWRCSSTARTQTTEHFDENRTRQEADQFDDDTDSDLDSERCAQQWATNFK